MTITSLTALLEDGSKSFNDLLQDARGELTTLLRPSGSFAPEQRQLLAQYVLRVSDGVDVAGLNQGQAHQIPTREAEDGKLYCPAKLLTNTRSGEPYSWAREHLESWLIVPVSLIRFVEVGNESEQP